MTGHVPKTAVVAGSRVEARDCARLHHIPARDWFYVSHPQVLDGATGLSVLRTGSYLDRRDLWEIEVSLSLVACATIVAHGRKKGA